MPNLEEWSTLSNVLQQTQAGAMKGLLQGQQDITALMKLLPERPTELQKAQTGWYKKRTEVLKEKSEKLKKQEKLTSGEERQIEKVMANLSEILPKGELPITTRERAEDYARRQGMRLDNPLVAAKFEPLFRAYSDLPQEEVSKTMEIRKKTELWPWRWGNLSAEEHMVKRAKEQVPRWSKILKGAKLKYQRQLRQQKSATQKNNSVGGLSNEELSELLGL